MTFISGVEAVGPLELEFKTATPRPIFANLMAGLYLVPERAWAEQGPERFVTNPIGTGSYRVLAWTNETVRMEAFRDAWRPAKVAKLEVLRLAEQASRLQALLSGQIDIMIQTNADEIAAIERIGGKIDKAPAPALMQLAYVLANVKQGVDNAMLKDKRVRHALNYAVDKDAINKALMGGAWNLNTQFAVPGAFGYDPGLKPWPYDPARARQLLIEAGYANGFSITGEVRDFFDIWGQVTHDFAKVGVKLELKNVVQADWLRKFLATTWEGPTFGLALGFGPEMDASRVALFQSCRKNPPHYCNKDVMPILDQVDAEFDANKRKAILQQIMAMMREDSPALMLFEQVDFVGLARRVQGFKSVNRIFNFHEMSLTN
jgi:peptide/nickel transport system substrate-binding protein